MPAHAKRIPWSKILNTKTEYLTPTQKTSTAKRFILNKYKIVKNTDVFYHDTKGIWRQHLKVKK